MFIIASLATPVSITTTLKDLAYLKQYVDPTECGTGLGAPLLYIYIQSVTGGTDQT